MKECIICKEKAGLLSSKTADGCVCPKCRAYLPSSIRLKNADAEYLTGIYQKNKERAGRFNCTASYGSLYIDSTHGMFCISETAYKGNPRELCNMFSITELLEVALYCSDVRNIGTNRNIITCNVKMRVKTEETSAEFVISRNESCSYASVGNKLEWFEPDKLIMFRNMFNQMIDNVRFGLLQKLDDIQRLQQEIKNPPKSNAPADVQWARGVLMLDNKEYPIEEIKSHYRKLIKEFHPDRHPELDDGYAAQIIKAYEMLVEKSNR